MTDFLIALPQDFVHKALQGLRQGSRFRWSHFPEVKISRRSTTTLCSSWTIEDLPMPE
jgi:hypothetical protein